METLTSVDLNTSTELNSHYSDQLCRGSWNTFQSVCCYNRNTDELTSL